MAPLPFHVLTPPQVFTRIERGLRVRDTDPDTTRNEPAFTLILGSGFSFGIVPTTRQMMHEEIGPCLLGPASTDSGSEPDLAQRRARSKEFWVRFLTDNPELPLELDREGLPKDVGGAYQALFRRSAVGGLEDVTIAHCFLRAMLRRAHESLNGAHFFLGAVLAEQRRARGLSRRPFCRTVFTTNFDPLLQAALQFFQLLYYMTDRPERTVDAAALREDEEAIHLIYAHGSIFRPFQASSEAEIGQLLGNAAPFRDYFNQRHVLVLGYSGWRDSLMLALQQRTTSNRFLYWCDIKPPAEAAESLSPEVRKLYEGPSRETFFYVPLGPGGSDAFMAGLYRRLHPDPGYPPILKNPFPLVLRRLEHTRLGDVQLFAPLAEPTAVAAGGQLAASLAPPESVTPSADVFVQQLIARLKTAERHWLEGLVAPAPSRTTAESLPVPTPAEGAREVAPIDAHAAMAGGRWAEAVRLWTEALEAGHLTDPLRQAGALIDRGVAHARGGNLGAAIDDYSRAIELAGASVDQVTMALNNRGVAHEQSGDREQAIGDYTRVVGLPGAPPRQVAIALNNRAYASVQQGELDRAIADYTQVIGLPEAPVDQVAIALRSRGVTYAQQGHLERALADYARVLELPQAPIEQVAMALNNRANVILQQGAPEEAIADYTRAIELPAAPVEEVAFALNNRGNVLVKLGRPAPALTDYTRALGLPQVPVKHAAMTLINRAYAWVQQGELDRAIADYTQAIELPEAPPDQVAIALRGRGVTYAQQGHLERALADYARVLELPQAPIEQVAMALNNRAYVFVQQGALELAIADYTRLIELPQAPPDQVAIALRSRGVTCAQLGHLERALADYARVLELPQAPVDEVAMSLNNRGYVYCRQGDFERAVADHTRVIELPGVSSQEIASAYNNRGWAAYRHGRGDSQAFLADAEMACRLDPSNESARFNRCLALLYAQRDAEALGAYREALASRPAAARVQEARTDLEAASASWLPAERAAPILAVFDLPPEALGGSLESHGDRTTR